MNISAETGGNLRLSAKSKGGTTITASADNGRITEQKIIYRKESAEYRFPVFVTLQDRAVPPQQCMNIYEITGNKDSKSAGSVFGQFTTGELAEEGRAILGKELAKKTSVRKSDLALNTVN